MDYRHHRHEFHNNRFLTSGLQADLCAGKDQSKGGPTA